MKKIVILMVLMAVGLCADPAKDFCGRAMALFEEEKGEEAKVLWEQAAGAGSAEAHYRLAYCYILPQDESRDHLVAAAKQGHAEALDSALEDLLFRGTALSRTRPKKALALYREAKAVNPSLELYNETNKVAVMEMCAELPPFDVDAFLEKYGVQDEDGIWPSYDVWELAEEASRGGRFGKPDPGLVFQLVARGGSVPAELEYAVRDFHAAWKAGTNRVFTIDDYVTSGAGMGYCSDRAHQKLEAELKQRLREMEARMELARADLLDPAHYAAFYFIECNVHNAEVHGGSGRAAWMLGSMMEQKSAYVELLEKAEKGWVPEGVGDPVSVTRELNRLRFELLEKLRDPKLERGSFFSPVPEATQLEESWRVWLCHADASPPLLHALNPTLKASEWSVHLAEHRIAQLKALLEDLENY